MKAHIAIQLWSVRDDCARDLLGTLRALAEIGYEAVEFAGLHNVPIPDIKRTLAETKLKVAGTHTPLSALQGDALASTLETHRALEIDTIIVPWLAVEKRNSVPACLETCRELSALTESLAKEGFRFGFHAHADDCKPLENGESAWDIIHDHTPNNFIMEFDTANGMAGGADVLEVMRAMPGRGELIHLKEYPWDGRVITEGEIPWAETITLALDTLKSKWLIVEQEQYGDRTPLECAALNLKNLRALLPKAD